MFRCAFIDNRAAFLVLAEREDKLEEAMDIVAQEYREYEEENVRRYTIRYRTMLGIPLDATISEERKIIFDRFGEAPLDNEEFRALLHTLQENYKENKPETPDWRERFEELGLKTQDITHHIVVGKGD